MTKDLTELKKQYDAARENFEKLGQEIERLEDKKPWFPEEGEWFYCINEMGGVFVRMQNEGFKYDDAANYREYFRTLGQAQRVRDARRAIDELAYKPYEIDWVDDTQEKWQVDYDHESKEWGVGRALPNFQEVGSYIFPDKETAQEALPHFDVLMKEGVL